MLDHDRRFTIGRCRPGVGSHVRCCCCDRRCALEAERHAQSFARNDDALIGDCRAAHLHAAVVHDEQEHPLLVVPTNVEPRARDRDLKRADIERPCRVVPGRYRDGRAATPQLHACAACGDVVDHGTGCTREQHGRVIGEPQLQLFGSRCFDRLARRASPHADLEGQRRHREPRAHAEHKREDREDCCDG